mmetsp:Transcript_14611/g.55253  ORF Transcript_14611/g.55253 Transcript_14611/m.55253 type:complete len:223 (+) Transcript_14611:230-898(+)|eukprot:scaffold895_cov315-Pinguiococcus_pyrenoidosus.AAC.64
MNAIGKRRVCVQDVFHQLPELPLIVVPGAFLLRPFQGSRGRLGRVHFVFVQPIQRRGVGTTALRLVFQLALDAFPLAPPQAPFVPLAPRWGSLRTALSSRDGTRRATSEMQNPSRIDQERKERTTLHFGAAALARRLCQEVGKTALDVVARKVGERAQNRRPEDRRVFQIPHPHSDGEPAARVKVSLIACISDAFLLAEEVAPGLRGALRTWITAGPKAQLP